MNRNDKCKELSLYKIAKVLYELHCHCVHSYYCRGCMAYDGNDCTMKEDGVIPASWDIDIEDVERYEGECNE